MPGRVALVRRRSPRRAPPLSGLYLPCPPARLELCIALLPFSPFCGAPTFCLNSALTKLEHVEPARRITSWRAALESLFCSACSSAHPMLGVVLLLSSLSINVTLFCLQPDIL